MGLLTDLLSAIDARKRVLASNLRDPVGAMGLLGGSLADERRRSKRETEEAARRAKGGGGLLGMSVMGGDRVTDMPEWEAAGLAPMGLLGAIKAYHGSPHKFDKFDMSKIGTGEGAQAYGHGLYFAENPGVANHYKVAEENVFPAIRKGDARLDTALRESTDIADNKIYSAISQNVKRSTTLDNATLEMVKQRLRNDADYFAGSPAGDAAEAALRKYDAVADNLRGAQFDYDPGHLYDVNLRWPDAREATDPLGPQHFLDWDKPLSQQPESVRKAVAPLLPQAQKTIDPRWGDLGGPFDPAQEFTGQQIVAMLRPKANVVSNIIGGGGRDVSAKLRAAGIPGIRYLDAGSRGAGQGTANYVMFDDALIEILKRNGMVP